VSEVRTPYYGIKYLLNSDYCRKKNSQSNSKGKLGYIIVRSKA